MKLKEVLDRTIQFFKEKKMDSPRLDAELLIARALGLRRIDLYLKFDQPLDESELGSCRELVRRRSQGEPVAYILGEKYFFGLTFQVDARVLIPRPETELLVEAALSYLKERTDLVEPQILDLGSGSGCLGLSILSRVPNAHLTSVDVSEAALEVAKGNAEKFGLSDRCSWILSDASTVDIASDRYDVIVANPPYISRTDNRVQENVARFEPKLALYAEDEGFAAISAWARRALFLLKAPGWIGFEFGAGQEERASLFFKELGFRDVKVIQDLSGLPRHVVGRKEAGNG